MPTPAPEPQRRFDPEEWRPEGRWWLWAMVAFAIGLLAFLLVVTRSGKDDFFRSDLVPPTAGAEDYPPLPAPMPGSRGSGIEPLPPPPVAEVAPSPPPPPPVEVAPAPEAEPPPARQVARTQPVPIAGRTPPPDYPRRALRRGEGGTTLVLASVGPDGVPTSVDIAQSSGSRDLDREAMRAVRRWRFEPATEGGRPVSGTVAVPIQFNPDL